MKPKITFNELELHEVLINSVRYCLTRRTYAVQECCDLLRDKWSTIAVDTQNIIEKDIIKHLEKDDQAIAVRKKELLDVVKEDRIGCYPILPKDHRQSWEDVLRQVEINREGEFCRSLNTAGLKLIRESK